MFNTMIDTVKDGQKKVVTAVVKDEKFATEINKLIDTQATFYKGMFDSGLTIAQTMVASAPKFPFTQGAK